MKLKITGKQILHYLLPSIISLGVLLLLAYLLKGSIEDTGPNTPIIYVLSLFIAGGFFFITAVMMYLVKLLRTMVPSPKEELADLKKQKGYLARLKKAIEKRYYFRKDLDEATFRHELQEIARKEIELDEKLAQMQEMEKPKKEVKKKKTTKEKTEEIKNE